MSDTPLFCPLIKSGCLMGGCAFWNPSLNRCSQTEPELKDSLEIGTAATGGAVKIYTDYRDKRLTLLKIDEAYEARLYAQSKFPPPAPKIKKDEGVKP